MKLGQDWRDAIAAFPEDRITRLPPKRRAEPPSPLLVDQSALPPPTMLPPTKAGRVREGQAMGIWDALQWAFRDQAVHLELPGDAFKEARPSFGLEWVMMERAKLGCRPDGGAGPDVVHEDAETLAAALANLPKRLGGLRAAIAMAESARSGLVPDWMPGAVPTMVPVAWKRGHRHGPAQGKSEVIGKVDVVEIKRAGRGVRRVVKTVAIRWTPIRWDPSREQIDAARRRYRAWWHVLAYVQRTVRLAGGLQRHDLTAKMPHGAPWADDGSGAAVARPAWIDEAC
ncbi:MAG: hypothetical protein AAGF30_00420 [Pseudomonadota bacterium]